MEVASKKINTLHWHPLPHPRFNRNQNKYKCEVTFFLLKESELIWKLFIFCLRFCKHCSSPLYNFSFVLVWGRAGRPWSLTVSSYSTLWAFPRPLVLTETQSKGCLLSLEARLLPWTVFQAEESTLPNPDSAGDPPGSPPGSPPSSGSFIFELTIQFFLSITSPAWHFCSGWT